MRYLLAFLMIGIAPLAQAQEQSMCPPVADHIAETTRLFGDLRVAPDATDAQFITDALWMIWMEAPDAKAQTLLDQGIAKRDGYDFLGARDTFDALVDYCPDYAEGYNQRAFASFLRQDYAAALVDIDQTLSIVPNHLGALSGKALTLMGLGRMDEAQLVLRKAVRLHPWMKERSMIVDPPGVDL